MYRENLKNRICTFAEVASALVMVQLGLMTEAYYCLLPFLFLLLVGFCHASRLEAEDSSGSGTVSLSVSRMAVHAQHIFLCIFSSEVSLLEPMPSGVARFLSLITRIACSFVCFRLVSFGACPTMNAEYSCFSSTLVNTTTATTTLTTTTWRKSINFKEPREQETSPEEPDITRWVGWSYFLEERNSAFGFTRSTDHVRWNEEALGWTSLTEANAQNIYDMVCKPGQEENANDMEIEGVPVLVYERPLSREELCNKELMPAMFQPSCEVAEADSVQYQRCLQTNAKGACNAAFMLCTTIKGSLEAPRFLLIFYICLPHVAVCLILIVFSIGSSTCLNLASGLYNSVIFGCLRLALWLWLSAIWLRHALQFTECMGEVLWEITAPCKVVCCGRNYESLEKLATKRRKRLGFRLSQLWAQQLAEIERVAKRNAEAAEIARPATGSERFKQEMQKKIQMKTQELSTQLDTGTFGSPFCGRRSLELKLLLFFFDILLDFWCCLQFFSTENYGFAACQCGIIIFSGCVQLYIACGRNVFQEWKKSWKIGLPTDTLLTMLVAEKAFEAPLSLCLQYFSAFHLTTNLRTFVSLEISMVVSIAGIGEGIYTSRLLAECTGRNVVPLVPKLPPHPEFPRLLTKLPSASKVEIPAPLPPPPGLSPNPMVLPPPPGLSPPRVNQGVLPPPPGLSPIPKMDQGAFPSSAVWSSVVGGAMGPQHMDSPGETLRLPPIQLEGQRIKDTE